MARNSGERGKKPRQRRERREAFPAAVPKQQKRAIGRSTTKETPLHIRARGLDFDDELRAYIRARVGFKLGKYAMKISRITVRFENVSGTKGAPAFACRFKVMLPALREVVLEETAPDARAAFDTAVDDTERAVRRLVGRTRKARRRVAEGVQ